MGKTQIKWTKNAHNNKVAHLGTYRIRGGWRELRILAFVSAHQVSCKKLRIYLFFHSVK